MTASWLAAEHPDSEHLLFLFIFWEEGLFMKAFASDDITPNSYQTCSGKVEMWVEGIAQTRGSCGEIHFDRVKQLVQSHKRNLDNDQVLLRDPQMSVFMLVAVCFVFPSLGQSLALISLAL